MTWAIAHFPKHRTRYKITYPRLVTYICSALIRVGLIAVTLPTLAHSPLGKVALAVARWVSEGKSTASVSITF